MLRRRHLAFLLTLTLPAAIAAAQQIDDPANLMGERVSPPALADDLPINHGAPALEQLLRKLRTRASLMLIVAHPDDEDSGMLTYESRGQGARVAMLTLTRGEGGQNLMSADFNDALGLIRTQELLAEDRYTGTDQFFGTEVDFGFSKTKEESFRKWTHERVLYDAVRAVRLYRPLVLASVFIGGVTDGHGQHQVAGEIAQEVFLAAADPKVFPEMGLPPWAPLRVYARVPFARIDAQGMFDYATGKYLPPSFHNYVTGQDTTTPPVATVTIHEGEVPAIPAFNGLSYAQWARQGLALQKTQIGPNFRIPTGIRTDAGYTLYGSRADSTAPVSEIGQGFSPANQAPGKDGASAPGTNSDPDLFTGIATTLPSIENLAPSAQPGLRTTLAAIDLQTAEAQKLFDPAKPELTAEPLRRGLKLLDDLIRDTEASALPHIEKFNLLHELRVKRVQFNNALVLALDIKLSASARGKSNIVNIVDRSSSSDVGQLDIVPGSIIRAEALFSAEPPTETEGLNVMIEEHERQIRSNPSPTEPLRYTATFVVSTQTAFGPYFTRSNLEQPFYNISVPSLRNAPAAPTDFVAVARFNFRGVPIETRSTVADALPTITPPTSDEFIAAKPAEIVPALSLSISPPVGLIKLAAGETSTVSFFTSAYAQSSPGGGFKGAMVLNVPSELNFSSQPTGGEFFIAERGQQANVTFHVGPAFQSADTLTHTINAAAIAGGKEYRGALRSVGYFGLPYSTLLQPATARAVTLNVSLAPGLRVAYLRGTGDDVPYFLHQLGIASIPEILSQSDLTAQKLAQYDVVVLGVRAYSAHPWLSGKGSQPLLDFATNGGVVIVQYSSAGFNPASAPYPYTVPGDSAHNVVEEEHPVAILKPENPLLTWPNRIVPGDFDHWIEERGHGFASEWSPEYTPLLETHDDGQDPQQGGLLVAKVGKGAYIYCALALYRQLPEGVPGAYRLFANLLSYAKNPGR